MANLAECRGRRPDIDAIDKFIEIKVSYDSDVDHAHNGVRVLGAAGADARREVGDRRRDRDGSGGRQDPRPCTVAVHLLRRSRRGRRADRAVRRARLHSPRCSTRRATIKRGSSRLFAQTCFRVCVNASATANCTALGVHRRLSWPTANSSSRYSWISSVTGSPAPGSAPAAGAAAPVGVADSASASGRDGADARASASRAGAAAFPGERTPEARRDLDTWVILPIKRMSVSLLCLASRRHPRYRASPAGCPSCYACLEPVGLSVLGRWDLRHRLPPGV